MRHGLLILRGSFRCLIHTGINADKSQIYAQRAYMIPLKLLWFWALMTRMDPDSLNVIQPTSFLEIGD
ncbi:hypothetical protein L6452_03679 [Arctium lappa]|uniref:Uncharacterized protein n=1 Tax=Arctium lappa TaxID=4217 RepID=A0ACB9FMA5_ARCLA|nr:hypothetical protein L6452_03679 [Arctium lappa]